MRIGDKGIELIKHFESCKLDAYPDSKGIPTIGFGHTEGVKLGQSITQEQADRLLRDDLDIFESVVNEAVKVPLTQCEFDALVSITFNVGPGAKGRKDGIIRLKSGQPSSLLRLLNQGNKLGAAEQFLRWDHAGGEVVRGLTRRRLAEKHLFLHDALKFD